MAKTHDVGKFYWHTMEYPVKPPVLLERAETQEIEPPYRGGYGWSFRVPFTRRALVIGKWIKRYTENEALTRAIVGRPMGQDEVDWDMVRYGAEDV